MKKILLMVVVLILISSISYALIDPKNYLYDAECPDCPSGCGGGGPSSDPWPRVSDYGEAPASSFCACGWTGTGCSDDNAFVDLYFNRTLEFARNTINISLGVAGCTYRLWDYGVYSWTGSEWDLESLNDDVAVDCNTAGDGNDFQVLRHPPMTTDRIRIEVIDTGSQGQNGPADAIYFAEIYFNITGSVFVDCEHPALFCDTFDYTDSFYNHDWTVFTGSGAVNNSLTPINDKMNLHEDGSIFKPFHETSTFPVYYTKEPTLTVTRSSYAPAFTSRFLLNVYNSTDQGDLTTCFNYRARDTGKIVYDLYFCQNKSIYYQTTTDYEEVCTNCYDISTEEDITISTYFTKRDIFPFNSTIENDTVEIWINDGYIANIPFYNNEANRLNEYYITKPEYANFTVDDYYVMVGTDIDFDTSITYFGQIYEADEDNLTLGTGTQDLARAVTSIWDDMGLKSTTSKIMTGLFLMFLLAVFMIGASISRSHHIPTGAIILVEIIFMIFLTYIGLLPIWILIILTMVGAGVGAWSYKSFHTG